MGAEALRVAIAEVAHRCRRGRAADSNAVVVAAALRELAGFVAIASGQGLRGCRFRRCRSNGTRSRRPGSSRSKRRAFRRRTSSDRWRDTDRRQPHRGSTRTRAARRSPASDSARCRRRCRPTSMIAPTPYTPAPSHQACRLVAIVAGAIDDHADPQHTRAARDRSAAIEIVAGEIDEEVDPTHGRARAGALLSDVLIVTGEVEDDLHARTIGRSIAVEVVSTRIDHAGDAGQIVCVGFRAAVDDPTGREISSPRGSDRSLRRRVLLESRLMETV